MLERTLPRVRCIPSSRDGCLVWLWRGSGSVDDTVGPHCASDTRHHARHTTSQLTQKVRACGQRWAHARPTGLNGGTRRWTGELAGNVYRGGSAGSSQVCGGVRQSQFWDCLLLSRIGIGDDLDGRVQN